MVHVHMKGNISIVKQRDIKMTLLSTTVWVVAHVIVTFVIITIDGVGHLIIITWTK